MGFKDVITEIYTFSDVFNDQDSFLDKVCELTPSTIDGFIDLSLNVIGSDDIASHMDAPVISMKEWTQYSSSETSTIPSVRPTSSDYIESVVSFINSLNSTRDSILILYSANFDASLLFPSLNSGTFIPVYMKEVNDTNTLEIMQFIKQLRVSEIILASEFQLVAKVVNQAILSNTLNGVYHWYVVSKDLDKFYCASCTNGNFILFRKKIDDITMYNKIMNINSSLATTYKAIDMVYAYQAGQILGTIIKTAKQNQTWSVSNSKFSCWNSTSSFNNARYNLGMSILKTIKISGVLGDIVFNNTIKNQYSQIMVSEVILGNSPVTIDRIKWTRTTGLGFNNISLNLLTQKQLRILVIPEPPFVIKLDNGTFVGYSIDIVAKLSEFMNFNYTFYEQIDGQYGAVLDNGTFSGLIGEMANKNFDMAVGAITITSERERVVDFSIPYYDYAAIQILMKKVTASTKGDQAFFLKAFTWEVWATVIATIIGTGFLICFVDRVSPFSFQNRLKTNEIREGEADGKIFTIKESMWFVLGAYTQAGESFDPRSISCRVIVVGLWLFAYLMMAMYTANLSAQLTVAKLASRPGSLTELAAQQSMQYTTQSNTSIHDYFFRMMKAEADIFTFWTEKGINNLDKPKEAALMSTWKYPIEERYTNMYNKMSSWGFTPNINDSIKKIIEDDWALFLETPIIKYYTNRDCQLVAVGEPFSQRPYGIVLQNNSPLLNELNLRILILQRDRILEQLKVKWWNTDKAVCPTIDSSAGLGLDTLGGAFAFLAVGIGIAGIIFIGEKIVAKIWGTEWAAAAGTDPTVVRPMGMMSTLNVNLGSHVSIRRGSQISGQQSMRRQYPQRTSNANAVDHHNNERPAAITQGGEINPGYDHSENPPTYSNTHI
uniref:DjGluR1 n=1 Tax=Dugesia japonica TaxID=6161 RepID=Q8MMK3_DUGJA|nr:DjGluR1 [Dugesia japonica]